MLNVPSEIQEVIKSDATLKNFRVHFPNGEMPDITNENIVYESVSFSESVCSGRTLRFGLSEASTIEFETVGIANMFGMKIECSMEFKVPEDLQETYGEWYSIPYGTFIVEKSQRDQQNMTHRRVTGYSLIKYELESPTFLQKRVLPVSRVYIPYSSMYAYLSGDLSKFNEYEPGFDTQGTYPPRYLFDSDGYPYSIGAPSSSFKRTGIMMGGDAKDYTWRGYILDVERIGQKTNEEFGTEIINWINSLNLDLRYDSKGKQIFETNEEAIRFCWGVFFNPVELVSDSDSDRNAMIVYRDNPIDVGKFTPIYFEEAPKIGLAGYSRYIQAFVGSSEQMTFNLYKYSDKNTGGGTSTTVASQEFSGFEANASFKCYRIKGATSGGSFYAKYEMGLIKVNSTLVINNSFLYNKTGSTKNYYAKMYGYSNAFSIREMGNGNAELSAGFVHSERDGTTNIDRLNASDPYQLQLSDIEGQAWWNEYDFVSRIGTVKYTFTNPSTGQIASGSYTFNPDSKSVYDLSGNAFLEAMDFKVYKTKKWGVSDDFIPTDCRWYVYNGTDTAKKNHFFAYHGSGWYDCGVYKDVTSIVEYVLKELFVPYVNMANFTPVEMDLRGLPFLEAGDAFTFTTQNGEQIDSFVLSHSIRGIQHLKESVDSVSGEVTL